MAAAIVVGVGAGIAAFKAAAVVRELTRLGHEVRVIPTPASLEFVGRATWEALSGQPVHTGVFEAGGSDHIEIARMADLILIAPATANLLARLSNGQADDLLTLTVLASTCPVVLAPAMHTAMWVNPATQDNIALLKKRGFHVCDPVSGELSSGDEGVGRLAEPQDIVQYATSFLTPLPTDLLRRRIIVTAGGTHEAIDPVRYIANRSTGRQGIAVAINALQRGADVTVIGANIDPTLIPPNLDIVPVSTAQEMEEAILTRLEACDGIVMAAAVADFRPRFQSAHKIKKDPHTDVVPQIELERTTDILAEITSSPYRPQVVIGFAAETGTPEEVLAYGRDKVRRKKADALAINTVGQGRGFGNVPNEIHLIDAEGAVIDHCAGTKEEVAVHIVNYLAAALR
ncbi:MAG: bifunctional phosphopantothenoylcysteine decarboxylase/phosphopantothenate--cysteine ligase CoaBC [Actinobacteria bacterium]|nr:MAG: bifunctional phosphopantothenoylcysteine decarboxylase/phosphopantothenate--cysteine ligase CoaBC [Actinomycetota bacterium]